MKISRKFNEEMVPEVKSEIEEEIVLRFVAIISWVFKTSLTSIDFRCCGNEDEGWIFAEKLSLTFVDLIRIPWFSRESNVMEGIELDRVCRLVFFSSS